MDRITRVTVALLWGMALVSIAVGCGTSPPTVPENVIANTVSSSEIDVSWDESKDFGDIDGYRVYRNGDFHRKIKGTSFRDSGLQSETEYCYRIRAVDEVGNRSDKSDRACATTFGVSTDTEAPTVPTNVIAAVVNATQIDLSWTASTDNIGVDHYSIYNSGGVFIDTSTGNSYSDTGLSAGIEYCYIVNASDAAGNTSTASSPPACATP
jgi:chitodextrinase